MSSSRLKRCRLLFTCGHGSYLWRGGNSLCEQRLGALLRGPAHRLSGEGFARVLPCRRLCYVTGNKGKRFEYTNIHNIGNLPTRTLATLWILTELAKRQRQLEIYFQQADILLKIGRYEADV